MMPGEKQKRNKQLLKGGHGIKPLTGGKHGCHSQTYAREKRKNGIRGTSEGGIS